MSLQEIKFSEEEYGNLNASIPSERLSLSVPATIGSTTFHIQGSLEIPGIRSKKQWFKITYDETTAYFDNAVRENDLKHSFPKIKIGLTLDSPTTKLGVKEFRILPPEHTVEAMILYTRFMFAITKAGTCRLRIDKKVDNGNLSFNLDIKIEPISELEREGLLFQSKLYRKLLYIEKVFGCEFSLPPKHISVDQIRIIETVFRGISEGTFSMRGPEVDFFNVLPNQIDITKPPFTDIGAFSHFVSDKIELFGRRLDTGPIEVKINHAELASPDVIDKVRKGWTQPLHIKFIVLDHQIIHRFDRYEPKSQKDKRALQQRLDRFKGPLSLVEPEELVNLVNEVLVADVSADEAIELASGWLQYNQLPDRYCPQDPIFEVEGKFWRVPIWLVYSSGQGELVGSIILDAKSGVIVEQPTVEEIRRKGAEIAQKLLHAS